MHFMQIPNNTLVAGDIIKVKAGAIMPALSQFLGYDLERNQNDGTLKKIPNGFKKQVFPKGRPFDFKDL